MRKLIMLGSILALSYASVHAQNKSEEKEKTLPTYYINDSKDLELRTLGNGTSIVVRKYADGKIVEETEYTDTGSDKTVDVIDKYIYTHTNNGTSIDRKLSYIRGKDLWVFTYRKTDAKTPVYSIDKDSSKTHHAVSPTQIKEIESLRSGADKILINGYYKILSDTSSNK